MPTTDCPSCNQAVVDGSDGLCDFCRSQLLNSTLPILTQQQPTPQYVTS